MRSIRTLEKKILGHAGRNYPVSGAELFTPEHQEWLAENGQIVLENIEGLRAGELTDLELVVLICLGADDPQSLMATAEIEQEHVKQARIAALGEIGNKQRDEWLEKRRKAKLEAQEAKRKTEKIEKVRRRPTTDLKPYIDLG